MRKIFIESCLLEEDTFLYGITMPGFFAMCMMGREKCSRLSRRIQSRCA
jgi:hypothetical protein